MIEPVIIGDATLYCGDCREMLDTISADAIVTDPPYGIGINKSQRLSVTRGHGDEDWDNEPIDADCIALLRASARWHIIWGGNYFPLLPRRCFLIWDKLNAGRDFADVEMAWTNIDAVARRFQMRPMNMDGGKLHPTQKPIEVMKWCLDQLPDDCLSVCDPFMGSGSTGVACAKRGLKFIGIERLPKYFDIACCRIEQAYQQPDMFIARPQPAVQEPLI
jgi:site-specific DNA-methyltransferase (adenine-specific)